MSNPPKIFRKFFRWYCHPRLVKPIEGDLMELYEERLKEKGARYANWQFVRDVVMLMRKDIIRPSEGASQLNYYGMFKHHLKTGYRALLRDKAYASVNILGLAIGMAVCLIIFQYVHFQLSYDTFHPNHTRTYRAVFKEVNSNTQEVDPYSMGYGFGPAAVNEIPEVKQAIRKEHVNRTATVTNPENQNVFYEEVNNLQFVDPSFFDVFGFTVLQGSKESLLNDDYNIVITERVAKKYFGKQNPIGKVLIISGPPLPGKYTVSGVLKDPPLNSHLQFDFLMPMNNYLEHGWGGAVKKNGLWNGFQVITYLTLADHAIPGKVTEKLNELVERNTMELDIKKEVMLQPVADIYLHSGDFSYPGHFNETGDIQDIIIFSVISLLILLIAWTNYINLATSQSLKRAKEVGIRKTMGAHKRNLVSQFILESILINLFAAVLSVAIAFLLLPVLNGFIEKELEMSLFQIPQFWLAFSSLTLLGALLAGIYPAFVLSGFRPISALKSQLSAAGNVNFRKGLIVFQFLSSILLISATYLIYKQVTFLKDQELTTDLDTILLIKGPRVIESHEKGMQTFAVFREEMAKHHSIEAVSGSLCIPGEFWEGGKRRNLNIPPSEAPHSRGFYVTQGFEKTYGFEFLAGGPFTKDMKDEGNVIMNESALALYDFKSPEDAINQKLFDDGDGITQTIVGVVKDFHWHSLQEDHKGYVLSVYEGRMTENISIRIKTNNLMETLEHVEASFEAFFPGNPFEYSFANEVFYQQYKSEQQFGKLFFFFSALAIFIGCVGLFALVSYAVDSKTKEIGIRKVLGASVRGIVFLLSKDYFKLILVAFAIAIPAIWIGSKNWLDNYANRISLSLEIFLFPAAIITLIAILTVSQRTIRSASANPVDSLRDE